jgi:hypothetical protein
MQKGFILPSGYIMLGMGAVILILGMLLKVQSSRLETCKAEHKAFVSEVERLGKEAKEKVKLTEEANLRKKEKADVELKRLRADNAEFKRLRDGSGERRLPQAPADSRNPELSCFDRSSLESAYGELVKELRAIADEGTEATIGLDTAKRWARIP